MKKLLIIALISILSVSAISSCGARQAMKNKDTLTGSPLDIMNSLITLTAPSVVGKDRLPESAQTFELLAEQSESELGIPAKVFIKNVESAVTSIAITDTVAHEIALLKCKNFKAADKIKDAIAKKYNSEKWAPMLPQVSAVIVSGTYVLMVSSRQATVSALFKCFSILSDDNVGAATTFFTHNGEDEEAQKSTE